MKRYLFSFTLLIFAVYSVSTYGDRRYFGRSYLSYTLPMGAFEFELWNTGRIGKDLGFFYRFQPRFEFEYGVTDRLSASLYFNFDQTTSEDNTFESKPFGFSSTSLEFRYRLTDPGEIFVDPGLYFEFAYGGDEIEYEPKLIFSKRIGSFIAAVNLGSEIEREVIEGETESVFEVTGGAMYEVHQNIALGIEFRNHRNYEDIFEEEEGNATFIGPTINLQTQSFFITFNFLAQVSGRPVTKNNLELDYHEKFEFRTVLGVEL
ncbi:MAG TPA: hypothetical protein VMT35_00855 [Ignavibacteriaceae bacterium]|nr:hypothetical protein [Ignavibacteriaceae bacterium]